MPYTIGDVVRANPAVFRKLALFTVLMFALPLFLFYSCQGAGPGRAAIGCFVAGQPCVCACCLPFAPRSLAPL